MKTIDTLLAMSAGSEESVGSIRMLIKQTNWPTKLYAKGTPDTFPRRSKVELKRENNDIVL